MESPRQPENVEQQTPAVPGPVSVPTAGVGVRRFPTPPALWKRMILLCLHPESWPMAARYRTWTTLMALGLAIVLAGTAAGIGDGVRFSRSLQMFGDRWESQGLPKINYTEADGLKVAGEWKGPIRFQFGPGLMVIDPTGATAADSLKMPGTVLINNKSWIWCGEESPAWSMPLSNLASGTEKSAVIDASFVRKLAGPWGIAFGFCVSFMLMIGNVLWAAAMMYLICPLVMTIAGAGERGIALPKRAGYRIVAASLVPLVIFGGAMHAAGYSLLYVFGGENAILFWFFAAVGMGIWTGVMARQMFASARKAK